MGTEGDLVLMEGIPLELDIRRQQETEVYKYFSIKTSAICTALVAAPLRILSETIHRLSPLGSDSSSRMRPTKTSSFPTQSIARGYSFFEGLSSTFTPGALASRALASWAESFDWVSTFTASECPPKTGTRTQGAVPAMEESPMIFLVSFTIFISSLVYPLSTKTSMWGR